MANFLSVGLVVVLGGTAVWFNEAARALVEPYGGSWTGAGSPIGLLVEPNGLDRTQVHWVPPAGMPRCWQVRSTALPAPEHGTLHEITDRTVQPPATCTGLVHWRLDRLEALARLGSWVWEIAEDRIEWSDGLRAMFGMPDGTALDSARVCAMAHPEDQVRVCSALAAAVKSAEPFSITFRMYTVDGAERIVECNGEAFTDASGATVRLLGATHDITKEHQARTELAYLAEHDPLTGVANRRRITARLAECTAEPAGATLLLIDIDHFKDINDLRGHAVGDRVMCSIAGTVAARLGPGAMLGRLGGDEFAVVLPVRDAARGIALGEQICDAVARDPIVAAGSTVRATVSVGVAPVAAEENVEISLGRADLALYEAKNAGRNRARLFAPDQYRQALARVTLLERVSDGLCNGTMELDAQPIVDLATGRTTRWELLIRLRDGLEPVLGPAQFLPAAERTDLVLQIDRWVLDQALSALASDSARAGDLHLEVNISARSMDDGDLGDWVLGRLRELDVSPPRLGLEITETTAITNLDAAQRLVGRLTAAGCGFSLDDFGSGFGSFSHLKHLPFTAVKIAGDFVRQLDTCPVDRALVGAAVGFADELGMRTVAEQVERKDLLERLRQLGVHDGQGYHLGRPRPLADMLRQCSHRRPAPAGRPGSG